MSFLSMFYMWWFLSFSFCLWILVSCFEENRETSRSKTRPPQVAENNNNNSVKPEEKANLANDII